MAGLSTLARRNCLETGCASYFQPPQRLEPKVRWLWSAGWRDLTISSPAGSRSPDPENNLIKSYHPRYNIFMRDDKTYPYLKVTTAEPFLGVYITREKKGWGVALFWSLYRCSGFKGDGQAFNRDLPPAHLQNPEKAAPALSHRDLDKCLAPCSSKVTVEEYRALCGWFDTLYGRTPCWK